MEKIKNWASGIAFMICVSIPAVMAPAEEMQKQQQLQQAQQYQQHKYGLN